MGGLGEATAQMFAKAARDRSTTMAKRLRRLSLLLSEISVEDLALALRQHEIRDPEQYAQVERWIMDQTPAPDDHVGES